MKDSKAGWRVLWKRGHVLVFQMIDFKLNSSPTANMTC